MALFEKKEKNTLREETSGFFKSIAQSLEKLKMTVQEEYNRKMGERIMDKQLYNEAHVRAIHPVVAYEDKTLKDILKERNSDVKEAKKVIEKSTKKIEEIEKKKEFFDRVLEHIYKNPTDVSEENRLKNLKVYNDVNENGCIIVVNKMVSDRNTEILKGNPKQKLSDFGIAVYDTVTNTTQFYANEEDFAKKNLTYSSVCFIKALDLKIDEGHGLDYSQEMKDRYDAKCGVKQLFEELEANDNCKDFETIINENKKRTKDTPEKINAVKNYCNQEINKILENEQRNIVKAQELISRSFIDDAKDMVKTMQEKGFDVRWNENSQTVVIKNPAINDKNQIDAKKKVDLILSYTENGISSIHYRDEKPNPIPIKVYDCRDKSKGILAIKNDISYNQIINSEPLKEFMKMQGNYIDLNRHVDKKIEQHTYRNDKKRLIGETVYKREEVGKYEPINIFFDYEQDSNKDVTKFMEKEVKKYQKAVGKNMAVSYNPYNNTINIEYNNSVLSIGYDERNEKGQIYFKENKTDKLKQNNCLIANNTVVNERLFSNDNFKTIAENLSFTRKDIEQGRAGNIEKKAKQIER